MKRKDYEKPTVRGQKTIGILSEYDKMSVTLWLAFLLSVIRRAANAAINFKTNKRTTI